MALVVGVLAGCGGSKKPAASASHPMPPATNTPSVSQFGPACTVFPLNPADPGSLQAMAKRPVVTAISTNPGLSTMVTAIKTAGLADSLNTTSGITVFVPMNAAFARMQKPALDALMADAGRLRAMVNYQVVPERLSQEGLVGTHKTLGGGSLTVSVSTTSVRTTYTVDDKATVVCGNITTSNASVYITDAVLLPPG